MRELWCVCGRRGGKSRIAAALAIYFALFVKQKLAARSWVMTSESKLRDETVTHRHPHIAAMDLFVGSDPQL
jgi:hypothetical protein